jgi:hypothetical protein
MLDGTSLISRILQAHLRPLGIAQVVLRTSNVASLRMRQAREGHKPSPTMMQPRLSCRLMPESSGRAPALWRTNAERNGDLTVKRVHFIGPGPAATSC